MLKKLAAHPVLVSIVFFACFLLGFLGVELLVKEPVTWVWCPLDDVIPFWRYAIVAYLLWFPWIPVTLLYLLFTSREELWQTIAPLYCGMALCIVAYIVFPNGQQLRPAVIEGDDVFAWAVRTIQGVDPPLNVCPSLHVLVTVHLGLAWIRSRTPFVARHPWLRAASLLLTLAICAATVLLKQHSVIDVFVGAALALLLDRLLGRTLVPRLIG